MLKSADIRRAFHVATLDQCHCSSLFPLSQLSWWDLHSLELMIIFVILILKSSIFPAGEITNASIHLELAINPTLLLKCPIQVSPYISVTLTYGICLGGDVQCY